MTTRQCRLRGGPYDGWEGEFVEQGQELVLFGPPGGWSFAYRRRPGSNASKPVLFAYDRRATRTALEQAGVPLHLVEAAVDGNREVAQHEESGVVKLRVEVRRNDEKKRWEMVAEGEVVDSAPLDAVQDSATAKQWVSSVLVPEEAA